MEYDTLNSELIERIPETFGGYAELRAMWDGDEPGPHVVYGDVLVPYAMAQLRLGPSVARTELFNFLEAMALSSDQRIRDVLGASVLEALASEPEAWALSKRLMGAATLELAQLIEDELLL